MTQRHRSSRTISLADMLFRPRGAIRPSFAGVATLKAKRVQGRPGADNAPAVCCAKCTRRRTAQQHTGGADHSAFPARWSDGLCRALPGAELSFWPPSPFELTMPSARLGSRASSIRLDRSNDGQDHTVLPYALSAARPHAVTDSQGLPALPAPLMPTLPRPPQARLAIKTTTRSPLLVSRDGRHIRQNRISVKWNIFAWMD
jgi:hypothetical protein